MSMIPHLFPVLLYSMIIRLALLHATSPCVYPLIPAPLITTLKRKIDQCWTQLFTHFLIHKIYTLSVKCGSRPIVYFRSIGPQRRTYGEGMILGKSSRKTWTGR